MSSALGHRDLVSGSYPNTDFDLDGHFDIEDFMQAPLVNDMGLDMDFFPLQKEKPGPVVDLTALTYPARHLHLRGSCVWNHVPPLHDFHRCL